MLSLLIHSWQKEFNIIPSWDLWYFYIKPRAPFQFTIDPCDKEINYTDRVQTPSPVSVHTTQRTRIVTRGTNYCVLATCSQYSRQPSVYSRGRDNERGHHRQPTFHSRDRLMNHLYFFFFPSRSDSDLRPRYSSFT